jgi:hypothetical protein
LIDHDSRHNGLRGVGLIFLVAVVVNYAWELAQTPLYSGVHFPGALWHCFVASLGDGLLVVSIYAAVAVAARRLDWYMRPAAQTYLAMATVGLAVSVAVEWWGLHIARRWQYSELMPILPGAEVGLAPVLQMVLLPPAVFAAVRRLRKGPKRR